MDEFCHICGWVLGHKSQIFFMNIIYSIEYCMGARIKSSFQKRHKSMFSEKDN